MNVRIMTIRTWDFRNRLWLRFHTTGCFSTKSNSMSNPSLLVQEVAAAAAVGRDECGAGPRAGDVWWDLEVDEQSRVVVEKAIKLHQS